MSPTNLTSSTPSPLSDSIIAQLKTALEEANAKQECAAKALFLHTLSPVAAVFLFVVLALFLCLLCSLTDSLVKKDSTTPQSQPIPQDDNGDDPPPYEAPPAERFGRFDSSKLSSATAFVVGTLLISILIFLLVLLGLCVHNITYCPMSSQDSTWMSIVLWCIFTGLAGYASVAVGCWLILLRNLWGRRGQEFVNIDKMIFLGIVVIAISLPFVLLGHGAVKGIEALQKRFCGEGPEESDIETESKTLLMGDEIQMEQPERVHHDGMKL